MHVVGGNYLDAYIVGKPYEQRQNALFLVEAVILYLDIKIFAEYGLEIERKFFRPVVVVVQQPARYAARYTCGKTDHPLGVLLQDFVVYFRLIIKAVDKSHRVELHEVLISRFIFR